MNIGRTVSVYTVEPVVSPVPREREQAAEPRPAAAEQVSTPPTPIAAR